MRRIILAVILSAVLLTNLFITVTGCNSDNIKDSKLERISVVSENEQNKIEFRELSNFEDYFLSECHLISDSRLLLVYRNIEYVYQFKIYDLKENTILFSSSEIQLEKMHGQIIHLLKDNFYYLYNGKCYVYDFSCQFIKELSIPENVNCFVGYEYWLSNDLNKIIYIKNPNLKEDCLYTSKADGSNEEKIMTLNPTSIVNLFFSEDDSCIGFEGVTIPKGKDTSIDCYGYITLSNKKIKIYSEDNTCVIHVGDNMLILDDASEYGAARKGKVRTLNISNKKHSVITMDVADECENATLGSNSQYMVGEHLDEENLTAIFTVYKDGKKIKTVGFECTSKQNLIDLSGSQKINFDVSTKQILVFYWNTELEKNVIMSLPVNIE